MITWIRADAPAFVTGAVFAALSDSRTGAFGAAQQVAADENASIAVPPSMPPADAG